VPDSRGKGPAWQSWFGFGWRIEAVFCRYDQGRITTSRFRKGEKQRVIQRKMIEDSSQNPGLEAAARRFSGDNPESDIKRSSRSGSPARKPKAWIARVSAASRDMRPEIEVPDEIPLCFIDRNLPFVNVCRLRLYT